MGGGLRVWLQVGVWVLLMWMRVRMLWMRMVEMGGRRRRRRRVVVMRQSLLRWRWH